MHITVKRSGGVTGMRPAMTIDTEQLIKEEAAHIESLVKNLPECPPQKAPGADRFGYRIIVEDDNETKERCLGEGQNSPLIGALFNAAKHTAEAIDKGSAKS